MAAVQVSPFRLDAKMTRKGFTLDFRGLRGNQVIDVKLFFPVWWIDHITGKLMPIAARRAIKKGS